MTLKDNKKAGGGGGRGGARELAIKIDCLWLTCHELT